MGWGFRKTLSWSGVRFTFSRSGVTTSVGRRGFRLSSGPRGVYVTVGTGGFYYRQRVGGRARRQQPAAQPVPVLERHPDRIWQSAPAPLLSDIKQEAFVQSLNEWTSRGCIQLLAWLVCGATFVAMLAHGSTGRSVFEFAAYAAIAILVAGRVETRRRMFLLMYDLDAQQTQRFAGLTEALAKLTLGGCLRAVHQSWRIGDWKRNAGATGELTFNQAKLTVRPPPYILTNIKARCLETQGQALWFLPDRILVRVGGKYAALSYDSLRFDATNGRFVWTDPLPSDAEVVDYNWQYPRRDGGPDRRFANNRQIPVVRVGYLTLESDTGLAIRLQSTLTSTVSETAQAFARYTRGLQPAQSEKDQASGFAPEIQLALGTLGLGSMPRALQLKVAYRELAVRNHPDRFASLAPELQFLAQERMKEINAAYSVLLPHAGVFEAETAAPSPALPEEAAAGTYEARHQWRRPLVVGVVATALVLVGFRLAPESASMTSMVRLPVLATAAPPVPPAPRPLRAATDRVLRACIVRAEPTTAGTKAGRIRAGTMVEVLDKKGSWRRIRHEDVEGWAGAICWHAPQEVAKTVEQGSGADADQAEQSGDFRSPGTSSARDPSPGIRPATR